MFSSEFSGFSSQSVQFSNWLELFPVSSGFSSSWVKSSATEELSSQSAELLDSAEFSEFSWVFLIVLFSQSYAIIISCSISWAKTGKHCTQQKKHKIMPDIPLFIIIFIQKNNIYT